MGFGEAVRTCLREKYFTFSGRASRSEYWYFYLFNVIIWVVFIGIFAAMASGTSGGIESISTGVLVVGGIIAVALYIPLIAAMVRRFHDRDMSGWWVLGLFLLGLIPYVGILASIAMLIITILKGTEGDNRFGPDPLVVQNSAEVFA